MKKPFEVAFCAACGTIHPKDMSCREADEVKQRVQQKVADAHQTGNIWMNRLINWRTVFLGKLWGSKPSADKDAPTEMARDLLAGHLSLLVAFNALSKLYIEGGTVKPAPADEQILRARRLAQRIESEAEWLCRQYERIFPGIRAVDIGLEIDIAKAESYMKDWPK